jgi:hypothetical protein
LLVVMALLMWMWWGRRGTPAFNGGAWRPTQR